MKPDERHMTQRPTLIVLPGDGIGPEVIGATLRIIDWFAKHRGFDCGLRVEQFGIQTYYDTGLFMRQGLMEDLMSADAVLFGALGSDVENRGISAKVRREQGLLSIRKHMQVFANLRPVKALAPLAGASPLRPHITKDVDLIVVRELTGGMYFGEPRGVETLPDGERRGVNTHVYTSPEIRRIARVAFELARQRRSSVISVDKANVMEAGVLWREEVSGLHAREFADVKLEHMYADNAAMQLVRNPRQFDVLLADNLFGDILSDEAAMITGSLGMLPSASLSEPDKAGRRRGFYEPVHGSAPDIAGQNKANPLGAFLSFAMALQLSFDRQDDARLLEDAVLATLSQNVRTADIAESDSRIVSTTQMTDAITNELDRTAR